MADTLCRVKQTGQYVDHWNGVYARRPDQVSREWHCEYPQIRGLLQPYLSHALASKGGTAGAHSQAVLMDIGCGGSTIAADIRDDFPKVNMKLHLLDISGVIIDALRLRYASEENVACEVADCRRLPSSDESVSVVVDKGTLDALHGDVDKLTVLRECKRVLTRTGVLVSISFGAASRINFLTRAAAALSLDLHIHVIGDGDPCAGHQVVFVAILAKDLAACEYLPSELTGVVLARVAKSGSVMIEDSDSDEESKHCIEL